MKRTLFPALIALACLALAWGGCKTEPKAEEVTWTRTADEVIIRIDGDIEKIHPMVYASGYDRQVVSQVFSYLLDTDPDNLEPVPNLAKARPGIVTAKEGPYKGQVVYVYEIHEAAVWDDGKPVTGHDYVFTLKAMFNPKVPAQRFRPFFDLVTGVEVNAENPKQFNIYASEPYMIGEEGTSVLPLMPAHIYDAEGLLADIPLQDLLNPEKAAILAEEDKRLAQFAEQFTAPKFLNDKNAISGCGPYRIEAIEPGNRVVLVKKENWWGDKLSSKYPALVARPARLVFKPITNSATAAAAIRGEEIDAVADIEAKDFVALRADANVLRAYDFHTPDIMAVYFINANSRSPKLQDKRVRLAIAHAIHVDEIIETLQEGFARRTAAPLSPNAPYYNQDLKPIPFDVNKAKALLAEAGWADSNNNGIVDKQMDGQLVELNLAYLYSNARPASQSMALLLQDYLKKAGIGLELVAKEFNVILQDQRSGNYELSAGGRSLGATLWEAKQAYHSEGDDRTGFATPATDALIDKIQVTMDEEDRNKLYMELQAAMYDSQTEILLFVPMGRLAVHKRFKMKPTVIHPGFYPNLFELKK